MDEIYRVAFVDPWGPRMREAYDTLWDLVRHVVKFTQKAGPGVRRQAVHLLKKKGKWTLEARAAAVHLQLCGSVRDVGPKVFRRARTGLVDLWDVETQLVLDKRLNELRR